MRSIHCWFVRFWVLGLGALLLLIGWPTAAPAAATVPAFDHIFVILMENHSYNEIIGNTTEAPYLHQLAAQYGVATNYFAVTHPSLPNYLALVGGSTFGITTDCTTCFVSAPNLAADRVSPSGRTWRGYMESMPSTCFVGDSGTYAQKHDPFIYFNDIRTTVQCNNVVPFTSFATEIASAATTPSFVWITPNLCHDMHDCSIATGDAWLQSNVPTILNSPAYTTQKSLLLITWDEDDGTQSNQVATLVIAESVPAGFRSAVHYDHYSLLTTIEQSWGLAPLTTNDTNASPMSDFFGASGTTVLPGAPTGVTAVAGRRSATVSWQPPTSNGGCAITAYTVTSSPRNVQATVGGSLTTATVKGLKARTTYTFTVTATNCVGTGPTSAPSNPVTPTNT
jgi:phosphatidylinositol-3-phosphatase